MKRLHLAIFLLLLAACHPGEAGPRSQLPTQALTSLPCPEETQPSEMPQIEPLSFSFPDPVPAAVSIWRPPLYETPWALGPYDHFYFIRPISVEEVNWPLADYRYGYFFTGTSVIHTGIDIDAPRGTTVVAAGPGEVVWAGYGLYNGGDDPKDPYGLAVTIRHDFGYQGQTLFTVYGHMDRVDVEPGQQVKAGDALGRVGNTGNTTGPHLHFEVRLQENNFFVSRNPELWLSPPEGWGLLVGRIVQLNGSPIGNIEVTVRSLRTGQTRSGRTYGPASVNSDDYYRENFVMSDLPEGAYQISIEAGGVDYLHEVSVHPGAVTYFTYQHRRGYSDDLPPAPTLDIPWSAELPFS